MSKRRRLSRIAIDALSYLADKPSTGTLMTRAITVVLEERERAPLRGRSLSRAVTTFRAERTASGTASALRTFARTFARETWGGHVDPAPILAGMREIFPDMYASHLFTERERIIRAAHLFIERTRIPLARGSKEERYWDACAGHLTSCERCQDAIVVAAQQLERSERSVSPSRRTGRRGGNGVSGRSHYRDKKGSGEIN